MLFICTYNSFSRAFILIWSFSILFLSNYEDLWLDMMENSLFRSYFIFLEMLLSRICISSLTCFSRWSFSSLSMLFSILMLLETCSYCLSFNKLSSLLKPSLSFASIIDISFSKFKFWLFRFSWYIFSCFRSTSLALSCASKFTHLFFSDRSYSLYLF